MDQLNSKASLLPRTHLQDWASLIKRLQAAALRARLAETEAKRRNFETEQLLGKARADVLEADRCVQASDTRLQDTKTLFDKLLTLAEERANHAEERAEAAEDLLIRFQESISGEFLMLTTKS